MENTVVDFHEAINSALLNQLRKDKGLTFSDMEKFTNISESTIKNILLGRTKNPCMETLIPICKVLGIPVEIAYEHGDIEDIKNKIERQGIKEENVPGAFFVLKNLVVKNKDLLMRMAKEGHLICNHTANHKNMAKATREEFETELKKMEDIYREVTGKDMAHFYRPPEGNFVEENLAWADEMGYATILWSFAYADWDNDKQPDPEYAKKKIYDNIHDGAIVLLHPTSATNAAILKEVIQTLKAQGYRFASLTELK